MANAVRGGPGGVEDAVIGDDGQGGVQVVSGPGCSELLHHLERSGVAGRRGGVVAGSEPVDGNNRVVTDHPGVMAARKRRDIARPSHELTAVLEGAMLVARPFHDITRFQTTAAAIITGLRSTDLPSRSGGAR